MPYETNGYPKENSIYHKVGYNRFMQRLFPHRRKG